MSKTWKKALSIVGQVLLWLFVISFAAVSLTMAIDKYSGYNASFMGYRSAAIVSSSMASVNQANEDIAEFGGNIKRGDVVVAKEVLSIDDVDIYDVVLYVDNNGTLVCHRVVEKLPKENLIVTRGDANEKVDGTVMFEAVKGVVVNVVPFVGTIVMFLQSYYGLLAICASAFFVSGGILIYKLLNDHDKKGEDLKET